MNVLSVSVTERGRTLAGRLPWEHSHGDAAATIRARWHKMDGFVLFLATGAAVRIVSPLLADKRSDPAVVCVDEVGRYAVALCGGHLGGANQLARAVAERLGAEPVITTATDAAGVSGLDQLRGFASSGDVAAVTAALLDSRPVRVENSLNWPLPLKGDDEGEVTVTVTDHRVLDPPKGHAVLHPPSLVAGIGTSSAASPDEVRDLLAAVVDGAGLAIESVAEVATIDRRREHPALVALGLPIRDFGAAQLAAVDVPTPSDVVRDAVGTASVCEAAALLASGPSGQLVVPKRSGAAATVAIARRCRPRGRLSVVGLGPGSADHRTPAAEAAVRQAELVIGYGPYLEQCADLVDPGQQRVASPIGEEMVRAKQALAEAEAGRTVALVCSGDAGTYAMASIVLELADGGVDVEVVPGITAASACAALLGAPLGHDHCAISLSDLLTNWDVIANRVRAAGQADLVVTLYNPRSHARDWQLREALEILREHRPSTTPVGIVTDAARSGQDVTLTTLGSVELASVGMTSCVVVGATTTRVVHGRMVTPRGYQ
ncbi:MAG: precorrin-3B C(17)-methyltransferase [Acidimicrobiales bacterium]